MLNNLVSDCALNSNMIDTLYFLVLTVGEIEIH